MDSGKTGNVFIDGILKNVPKLPIPPVKVFPSGKEYVRKKEKRVDEEQ